METNMTKKEVIELTKKTIELNEQKLAQIEKELSFDPCCLRRCNTVIFDPERTMTLCVDKDTLKLSHEFFAINPTMFAPEVAEDIIAKNPVKDCNGNAVKFKLIGEREYLRELHKAITQCVEASKWFLSMANE